MSYNTCDTTGLLSAMYDFVPFIRDGIYLLHKEGPYVRGPSELCLVWKDLTCSRYLIETDMEGIPTEHQFVTLQYMHDGGLYTSDEPPIRFGDLSECSGCDHLPESKLQPTRLLKFVLYENLESDSFHLEFAQFVRNRRKAADLFSKILFQRRAREGQIRSEDLIHTVKYM